MKHTSPIRCADGVELINRFAKNQMTLRASSGFGGVPLLAMHNEKRRANDTAAFMAGATPQTQQLPDTSMEQQKMLAQSQSSQGPDQGEHMMQSMMSSAQQNPNMLGGGSAQDMSYALGQAQTQARGLQMGLQGSLPTGGALGTPAQDPRMSGRPSGLGMALGGELRTGHGGAVPGTGHGDKIHAKYEPGEFVVSNDMLDADPALLAHLRGLRKAVLAAKGTTPEAADAKAMGGLRAH